MMKRRDLPVYRQKNQKQYHGRSCGQGGRTNFVRMFRYVCRLCWTNRIRWTPMVQQWAKHRVDTFAAMTKKVHRFEVRGEKTSNVLLPAFFCREEATSYCREIPRSFQCLKKELGRRVPSAVQTARFPRVASDAERE